MKYVIHSTITFDTTEYILASLHNANASIKLSNTAGRILEELIICRNIEAPVTREHLFSVVWRANGLVPSNGNLNQQISLIRKTLTNLGLQRSSIITIPKLGLKLNNQLIIEKMKNETTKNITSKKDNTYDNNINIPPAFMLNIKSHIKYIITLAIVTIFIFSIGLTYFYTKENNIKLYCCKEIDSCNICTLHHIDPYFDCCDYHTQNFEII